MKYQRKIFSVSGNASPDYLKNFDCIFGRTTKNTSQEKERLRLLRTILALLKHRVQR